MFGQLIDFHAITPLAILAIAVAFAFDFSNGWHDAANSIATVVSTQVLSPRTAVAWAAFFNFIAAFGFGTAVAKTIGKDVVNTDQLALMGGLLPVVFYGLAGAIAWNIITWYVGIPSSSSHALAGGICGAGVARAGFAILQWVGLRKIVLFIVLSPLIGFLLGTTLMIGLGWIFRRFAPLRVDRWFRSGQLFSAALFSYFHGTNDAQKTMGIMFMVLVSCAALPARLKPVSGSNAPIILSSTSAPVALGDQTVLLPKGHEKDAQPAREHASLEKSGKSWMLKGVDAKGEALKDAPLKDGDVLRTATAEFRFLDPTAAGTIPWEVIILCHIAMGLGTASGGWRIVKTMGMKITKLKPVGGFAAETATGLTLGFNALLGIPVSTTHVITGAIMGVGSTRGTRAVKWGVARQIVVAWGLTIPASAGIAWLLWHMADLVGAT
ncbi:MAG TPA: inorganic phosphate transporter [bacterium]|nr:inorganic phosphate transporter [bacterium]